MPSVKHVEIVVDGSHSPLGELTDEPTTDEGPSGPMLPPVPRRGRGAALYEPLLAGGLRGGLEGGASQVGGSQRARCPA